jgi:sialic acid synthase SpsE
MRAGEIIQRKDIKIMRPGTGFHVRDLNLLVGRTLKKDIRENEIIPFDAF